MTEKWGQIQGKWDLVRVTGGVRVTGFYRNVPLDTSSVVNLSNVTLTSRLLAVPFWIVERAREIAERKTGARRKKKVAPVFSLGYFARPLDYPDRDC